VLHEQSPTITSTSNEHESQETTVAGNKLTYFERKKGLQEMPHKGKI